MFLIYEVFRTVGMNNLSTERMLGYVETEDEAVLEDAEVLEDIDDDLDDDMDDLTILSEEEMEDEENI